ncbi:DUF881 domain-containing protein [Bifidobacterium apri]|uniref:Protein ylxX/ylxW n=1 Tax=Bifidobacterium apri TaxID=1769423 RepID=A0A6A2V6Z4_9BIFI|nr:DUF881 domain-containing protein [Bifidobacterium apri]KAB8296512.1 hypothetical protein DSM100238_1536 [Bifidobacterium apri]
MADALHEASKAPDSIPVPKETAPVRTRAVFSASASSLGAHHAASAPDMPITPRRRRPQLEDDSLRLIDDLTNRPMDPMFIDSRLDKRPKSALHIWLTRVIVFIICIAVGFSGSIIVQILHTDPRKEIRSSLAKELTQQTKHLNTLNSDVSSLRVKVENQSKKLANTTKDSTLTYDEMANGTIPVTGPGITLTIANPIAANSDTNSGSLPRESSSNIRVVTDADLQVFIQILWQAGAEAIAINGYRLGVQTSVRTAGQTILVGVNQVQNPYKIQAIGDRNALAAAVGESSQQSLYATLKAAGIYPQISTSKSITLEAANSSDISYAERAD